MRWYFLKCKRRNGYFKVFFMTLWNFLEVLRLIVVTDAGVLRMLEQIIAQILFLVFFNVKIYIVYSHPVVLLRGKY